mgnify:CR=1 FL=1
MNADGEVTVCLKCDMGSPGNDTIVDVTTTLIYAGYGCQSPAEHNIFAGVT